MKYETDIFLIENLDDLSAKYRLLQIVGLNESNDDFDSNVQYIVKTLSYRLKHPVTAITKGDDVFLVIKDEPEIMRQLPSSDGFPVKRGEVVYFNGTKESVFVDFRSKDPMVKQIILRFLQFDLAGAIRQFDNLWQPESGDSFFSKKSYYGSNTVEIFNGFTARIVELEDAYGVCIDVTKKYASKYPQRVHLTKPEFEKLKRSKCHLIYRYGGTWYEIRPEELSKLSIAQYKFKREDETISLLEDLRKLYKGTLPPDLAKIPDSASVIVYRNKALESKGAIAAMCYRTYDTEDPEVSQLHRLSIMDPFTRRRDARIVVNNYISKLQHGSIKLKVSPVPMVLDLDVFDAPDLLFNGCKLSTRRTNNALQTTMESLGRDRRSLLLDKNVGFYTRAAFDRQYVLVPESIHTTYGNSEYFLKDLASYVDRLHPTDRGWKPQPIPYNDRDAKTSLDVAVEILDKMKRNIDSGIGGYAVVILPGHLEKEKKMHDETAAMVVYEAWRDFSIKASIMHTKIMEMCFEHEENNGEVKYAVRRGKNGQTQRFYNNYVAAVAINQVLLNNERWPYVLATPLHADLTIGIDVKRHIAGFTFIDKYSKNILPYFDKSTSKEKLSTEQVGKVLIEQIRLQRELSNAEIKKIVFHRDGRIFRTELKGIEFAMKVLKKNGVLPEDVGYDVIEIPKSSIIPFRLFEILNEYNVLATDEDNGNVANPRLGTWAILNSKEAFLCTTGKEFPRRGSSNPLFVKHAAGNTPFKDLLEDIYYLSHLCFTKPDDCSRNPLTIKITDRRINLIGAEYDEKTAELLKTTNLNVK